MTPAEWFIERVPASALNRNMGGWKELKSLGWDVAVVLAPDSRSVVVLGCRS